MKEHDELRRQLRQVSRLMSVIMALFFVLAGIVIYVMIDPNLSAFKEKEKPIYVDLVPEVDDFDKIENGVHVRTGLKEGEGLMTVVNNCTNCHSALLVTQNRMSADRWRTTIKWMQETQNLWDLGKNEEIIINYLVTHYPPQKKGRRMNLNDIEWYVLED